MYRKGAYKFLTGKLVVGIFKFYCIKIKLLQNSNDCKIIECLIGK